IECASGALDSMDHDEARGTLQRSIASLFARCPRGATAVLHDVSRARPEHVPALLPALSENGAYMDRGRAVSTTFGTVLLLATLPGVAADAADEKAFTNAAKRELLEAMRAAKDGRDDDGTALAFRRRIDVAIP
ncbi:hypothetical protein BE221DRAFT_57670, partial [Ostreococcus tauri]